MSSLRKGHANLVCIIPNLTDDLRKESNRTCLRFGPRGEHIVVDWWLQKSNRGTCAFDMDVSACCLWWRRGKEKINKHSKLKFERQELLGGQTDQLEHRK